MNQYVFGVDVGGTNIKLGIFELPNVKLVKLTDFPTPNEHQDTAIFDAIVLNMQKVCEELGTTFDHVKGVGLAIPCPVIGGCVDICANVGLNDLNIEESMKLRLPKHMKVAVGNDASLAAFGENKELKTPYDNAVFYTLGTGVGGGLIINGKLIEGKNGAASEFGHMKVFDGFEGEVCGCGKNGCLEQIAGTKGIFRLMKQYSILEKTVVDLNDLTVKRIFDAAKMGDGPALKTVNRVANVIGESAAAIAMIVDPEVFIIGGGIAASGKFFLDKIIESYQKNARFKTISTPIVLASLGNKAGAFGAAHLVKDRL